MNAEVIIIKDLPIKQIQNFEDKVVYNTALLTREYTKNSNAYPYLSGKLRRTEVATPIVGSNKEYGLTAGVNYAKYVWNMSDVKWTNQETKPKWYFATFKNQAQIIVSNAVMRVKKEI